MYRASRRGILFMYLKKLYRQSKFWFIIIIMFAVSQVFLDYKNGVELSPFYHYGMFSLPFHFTPNYECVEVKVNGKLLQTKDLTPNGWDNVVMPIIQYNHQQRWNSEMYNQTISRLLHVSDSTFYTNQLTKPEFNNWYGRRILNLLNVKDSKTIVRYDIISYKQENGKLVK